MSYVLPISIFFKLIYSDFLFSKRVYIEFSFYNLDIMLRGSVGKKTRRSRKKSPASVQRDVVQHFVIIQRTVSTPHDYKICTPFLSRYFLAGEFELFTKPSKPDF